MNAQEKVYAKQQKRIPVGTRVAWTKGTYHVDHTGREINTGVIVSHTLRAFSAVAADLRAAFCSMMDSGIWLTLIRIPLNSRA